MSVFPPQVEHRFTLAELDMNYDNTATTLRSCNVELTQSIDGTTLYHLWIDANLDANTLMSLVERGWQCPNPRSGQKEIARLSLIYPSEHLELLAPSYSEKNDPTLIFRIADGAAKNLQAWSINGADW